MNISGIILSGGLNTRIFGQNKSFLTIGQETFLQRLIRKLRPLFSEMILVTRQPDLYPIPEIEVVSDIYPIRSSLTGIHAGLVQAKNQYAFITACDTPLLKPELVQIVIKFCDPDVAVVVPEKEGHFEPLCAIYSKKCLPLIEEALLEKELKINKLFQKVPIKVVPQKILEEVDPELESFYNVNTLEDWELLRFYPEIRTKAK